MSAGEFELELRSWSIWFLRFLLRPFLFSFLLVLLVFFILLVALRGAVVLAASFGDVECERDVLTRGFRTDEGSLARPLDFESDRLDGLD